MNRDIALDRMRNSLECIIREWLDKGAESKEREALGYIPGNASGLMAKAAMIVLESSEATQDEIRNGGHDIG